jgi:Zn-dependent protease
MAGIPVRLTPGAYLLGALAAGLTALDLAVAAPGRPAMGYLAATAGVVVVLLASLVAHELAHAVVARHHGRPAIVRVGFFGGSTHGRADLPSPRAQWQVAAAGPALSLLLAGLSLAAVADLSALGVATHGTDPLLVAVITAAAWINGLLAVANLVPGAGLDGGRIIRALAWARSGDPARAGRIAVRFGQVSGAVLTTAGVAAVALGHRGGLWFGLMGLLMVVASRAKAGPVPTPAALTGLRVRDVLPADRALVPSVRGWQTVQAFLDGRGEPGTGPVPQGHSVATAYPVRDFDGQLAGLVTLSQLTGVPAGRRAVTRLSQVATPLDHLTFTTLDEPLAGLRARLGGRPASPAALPTGGHALVLGPWGELAGVLTPADFARATQLGLLAHQPRAHRTGRDPD